jgi:hypothetical protein
MQYCCKDEAFDRLWLTTWLTEWVTDGIPYLLITCSGVIFEDLVVPRQLKFSSFSRTRRLKHDRHRKIPPLLPIPRQMNSLHTPPSYPFKMFSSHLPLGPLSCVFPSGFSNKTSYMWMYTHIYIHYTYIYIYIYIYIYNLIPIASMWLTIFNSLAIPFVAVLLTAVEHLALSVH